LASVSNATERKLSWQNFSVYKIRHLNLMCYLIGYDYIKNHTFVDNNNESQNSA